MKKKIKVLLVGPINNTGAGGRFEEMKVWTNSLESPNLEVWVHSMFNSRFTVGNGKMIESVEIEFGFLRNIIPFFKPLISRIWASKFFKARRENFYLSESWVSFASSFDRIILFINDSSKERLIFESNLTASISIRYTGVLHNLYKIELDNKRFFNSSRSYIFHDKALLKGYKPALKTYFIDQTVIKEKKLLSLPIKTSVRVFGMVGLFMTVKQINHVIKVFKFFPEFELLLYGEGELKSEYENLIKELKISNVKLQGYFAAEEIENVYSEFDCLIINSSDETGPMTGVEAMAAGKLILSRPVGAMETRLNNSELVFNTESELIDLLKKINAWTSERVKSEKVALRNRYLDKYSNVSIRNQILSCLEIK